MFYATSWAAAIVYFAFALLAVIPAPTYLAWQLSVLATEWGYWFALPGLLAVVSLRLFVAQSRSAVLSRRFVAPFGLVAISGLLLLTPLTRAAALPQQLNWATLFTGAQLEKTPPVTYVYAPSLPLDFYRTNTPNAPLVVVIHGGSWSGGDQKQLPNLNWHLAQQGYAVAAITYRLSPAHRFPAAVDDVRTALTYLKAHAHELGFDSTRIVLLGRSAGGQLALITAYTSNDPAIKGAISFYGITDLRWGWDHPSPKRVLDSPRVLLNYLGGPPAERGAAYDSASAINFAATATRTLLVHGGNDELASPHHSRLLARRLKAAGKRVEYLELPWSTHGCDCAFNGPCGQLSTRAVMRFLGSATNVLASTSRPDY